MDAPGTEKKIETTCTRDVGPGPIVLRD